MDCLDVVGVAVFMSGLGAALLSGSLSSAVLCKGASSVTGWERREPSVEASSGLCLEEVEASHSVSVFS